MAARCIMYTQQVLLVCVASGTHNRCILYAQQVYPVRTTGCILYAQQVYPVRTIGVSCLCDRCIQCSCIQYVRQVCSAVVFQMHISQFKCVSALN